MIAIQTEIVGSAELQAAFVKLGQVFDDLSPVFEKIGPEFFDQTRERFDLAGPGWPALSSATEARKARLYGGPTRILRATDRLYESFKPAAVDSIERIDPLMAEFGSSVPYGVFHDSPEARTRLPRRAIIQVTDENAARFKQVTVDVLNEKIRELGFEVA